jgi:hypothetical protein
MDMRSRLFEMMVAAAIMMALWVVPSGALQGRANAAPSAIMCQRHVDHVFAGSDAHGQALLAEADSVAAAAVAGLRPGVDAPHPAP